MSKRSRGQMMVKNLRTSVQGISSEPLSEKSKPGMKSPLKTLLASPAVQKMVESEFKSDIADEVAKISSCFKILNNSVTSFHNRRKKQIWESLVESYQTISPCSLSIDDLATILTIWKDAFILRWQANSFDSASNPRSYELLVELPTQPNRDSAPPVQSMDVDEQAPQMSSSALMSYRIDMFNSRLFAMAEKATAQKAASLSIKPDFSLIPSQPVVTLPEKKVRTINKAGVISEWEATALKSAPLEGKITLDMLRERAIIREKIAIQQKEKIKAQVAEQESDRLLQLLPSLADAFRSIAVRKNRTNMTRKDSLEGVTRALQLRPQQVSAGMELLCSIVPEFLSQMPAELGVPATVSVNRRVPYKDVRGTIVEYVRSHTKPAESIGTL